MPKKSSKPLQLHPIRKIVDIIFGDSDIFITRECGHMKKAGTNFIPESMKWSICHECPPLSSHWVDAGQGTWGYEWICLHGVGHYDPRFAWGGDTTHGCDGCCGRDDVPWEV